MIGMIIDLMLINEKLQGIMDWRVEDEESFTDHKYIHFKLDKISTKNVVPRTNLKKPIGKSFRDLSVSISLNNKNGAMSN